MWCVLYLEFKQSSGVVCIFLINTICSCSNQNWKGRHLHAREPETGEQNELVVTKAREMANIKTEKFNNMVQAIGSDTISAIATSSPEMQVCIVCCVQRR